MANIIIHHIIISSMVRMYSHGALHWMNEWICANNEFPYPSMKFWMKGCLIYHGPEWFWLVTCWRWQWYDTNRYIWSRRSQWLKMNLISMKFLLWKSACTRHICSYGLDAFPQSTQGFLSYGTNCSDQRKKWVASICHNIFSTYCLQIVQGL